MRKTTKKFVMTEVTENGQKPADDTVHQPFQVLVTYRMDKAREHMAASIDQFVGRRGESVVCRVDGDDTDQRGYYFANLGEMLRAEQQFWTNPNVCGVYTDYKAYLDPDGSARRLEPLAVPPPPGHKHGKTKGHRPARAAQRK